MEEKSVYQSPFYRGEARLWADKVIGQKYTCDNCNNTTQLDEHKISLSLIWTSEDDSILKSLKKHIKQEFSFTRTPEKQLSKETEEKALVGSYDTVDPDLIVGIVTCPSCRFQKPHYDLPTPLRPQR